MFHKNKNTFSSSNQNDEIDGRGSGESGVAMGRSSFSPAHHVEGNKDDGSFQNSKTSNKSTQRQDGGVLDTHICQVADARLGWDIKVIEGMVLGQNEGLNGEGSDPIPMEKLDSVARFEECNVIRSKSYPTSTEECYVEVSSPFKPNCWAETPKANEVQATT
nr:hypothetical protein CFP56_08940 [Quercus suber]